MAKILKKADIVRALTEANIEFDAEAPMTQLRPLYDNLMAQNMELRRRNETDVNLQQLGAQSGELQQQLEQSAQQPNQNVTAVSDATQQPNQSALVSQVQTQQPMQNVLSQQPNQSVQQMQIQSVQLPDAQQQPVAQNWALQISEEEAELDRQMAILRKKRELLELQRELQQMETRRIDLKVLEAMMSGQRHKT